MRPSQTKFRLRYTAIEVTNIDRSINFYTKVLGMRVASRRKVAETKGELAILESARSDHWIEINCYENHQYESGDALDHIAFQVPSLEKALAELKTKGIKPISYTRESPRSKWTYIRDPDGIWIEIFEH